MVPRAREDIDAKALAEQWGVNRMGVVGMISQAKSNKKLYNDLIRAGYEDSEFPSWWYSPARDEGSSTESGNVELRPDSPVKPVLEAHPPETSIPRDQGAGRPTIQDSTLQDDAGRCWTMLDDAGRCWTMLDDAGRGSTSSGLTEQEVALLNARAITQITPGQWMHTQEGAGGTIVLTPVDPRMELQMIEGQTRGDAIARAQIYSLILLMNSISLIIWL